MKLIKIALLASLAACSVSAMANTIAINNSSSDPIPVKYQLAYHNPGQPVVLKAPADVTVDSHGTEHIIFSLKNYKHAGVVVIAVKHAGTWHYLPKSLTQFDGNHGCWMRTDKKQTFGEINFAYHKTHGVHSSITCNTALHG